MAIKTHQRFRLQKASTIAINAILVRTMHISVLRSTGLAFIRLTTSDTDAKYKITNQYTATAISVRQRSSLKNANAIAMCETIEATRLHRRPISLRRKVVLARLHCSIKNTATKKGINESFPLTDESERTVNHKKVAAI